MRILEFKHVAGYLPYGLSYARCTEKNAVTLEPEISVEGFVSTRGDIHNLNITILKDYSSGGFQYKPILRSLESLSKQIEHDGDCFVPIEELLKIKFKDWVKQKKGSRYSEIEVKSNPFSASAFFSYMANYSICVNFDTSIEKYCIIQKLHEWKFDTENLIKDGLALDVEDLILNPYTFQDL